jgi:hypothetical protein
LDALSLLLSTATWAEIRARFWGREETGAAIGYRFEIPNPWEEPEITLTQTGYRDIFVETIFELDTDFRGVAGRDCGTLRVRFVKDKKPKPPGYLGYLIDDPDIEKLLRFLGSCAAK